MKILEITSNQFISIEWKELEMNIDLLSLFKQRDAF